MAEAALVDSVNRKPSSRQVPDDSPPKRSSRREKGAGKSASVSSDSTSVKSPVLADVSLTSGQACLRSGKSGGSRKRTSSSASAPASTSDGCPGLAPAEVASLLLTLSAQVSTLASELSSTREELRALPSGVSDVLSLAQVRQSPAVPASTSALPSATVTRADVHASQDGSTKLVSLLCGTPVQGMSTPLAGVRAQGALSGVGSRESSHEQRKDERLRTSLYENIGDRFSPLPPGGQEVVGSADDKLSDVLPPGSELDLESECRAEDGDASVVEDSQLNLPVKLSAAVALAAETAFRYFPEGVVKDKAQLHPPRSAFDDFRSAQEQRPRYRFRESSTIAYEMANVLCGKRKPAVPLLVQHGEAPEDVVSWLAQPGARAASGVPKFKLTPYPVNLIDSFALPLGALPVTPELAALREDGYNRDRVVPCTDGSLTAVEEVGRSLLELTSVSESLQRSLSRSIATSLDPFEFRFDASPTDVSTLLATLGKVTREQVTLSARLYTHAVLSRRSAFLTGSRFRDTATVERLKVSPFAEGSLLGQASFDALQKETQDARDVAIARLASQGFQKPQGKSQTQAFSSAKPQTSSSGGGKAQKQSFSSRGRGRGAPYPKRGQSFGGSRGSGRKPHPQ
ncbi:streptococcal hemagglutinin-like isoform X1 [Littorina saxatilis]|uniref:streptococcal hemagglutinin-like isoform X1 n=1 Tax=Littorina saxatilis TaxID=31220 RepID=UPI0038B5CB0C